MAATWQKTIVFNLIDNVKYFSSIQMYYWKMLHAPPL